MTVVIDVTLHFISVLTTNAAHFQLLNKSCKRIYPFQAAAAFLHYMRIPGLEIKRWYSGGKLHFENPHITSKTMLCYSVYLSQGCISSRSRANWDQGIFLLFSISKVLHLCHPQYWMSIQAVNSILEILFGFPKLFLPLLLLCLPLLSSEFE